MRGGESAPGDSEMNRPGADDFVPPRILLVEHSDLVSKMIATVLRRQGHSVCAVSAAEQALAQHEKTNHFDLFIGEAVLPGARSGYSLAQAISARQSGLPSIFVTGHPPDVIARMRDYSASHTHLFKPFGIAELATLVSQKLRLSQRGSPFASASHTGSERW